MIKQPTLPTILRDLISKAIFTIDYGISFDNGDGTYTLGGICDIHHVQPGSTITVNGIEYTISDYLQFGKGWKIILTAGDNPLPPTKGTIVLPAPYFIHGTPIEVNAEHRNEYLSVRTPVIYLMEPFQTNLDYDPLSNIASRPRFTLCFLGQAETDKWTTDQLYHYTVEPMYRLAQDFMQHMIDSFLFNTVKQTADVVFYAKFGIIIKGIGTTHLYDSDKLAGVGMELSLEVYKDNSCCGDGVISVTNIELREDGSIEERDAAGLEIRN